MWPQPAMRTNMQKKLIILTTAFGSNFSGGSRATCEVINRIQNEFSQIIVLGTQLGNHEINSLQFIKVKNWFHAYRQVKQLDSEISIYYGDFYNAFILAVAKVKYAFTYHDNWPELSGLNTKHFLQNLFYFPLYKQIFKHARKLITVSQFKQKQLKRYHKKVELIPNGFTAHNAENLQWKKPMEKPRKVLMVGNIDQRKYAKALPLFEKLAQAVDFEVDIYGHIIDRQLANKLTRFPFVNFKGFTRNIPFNSYRVLLHTSFTESFGMVFCEAIFNGVPVLAFEGSGASELVVDQNGTLVPKNEPHVLQERLKQMVNKPFLTNPVSVKNYSWAASSDGYRRLFQDV